MENQEEKKVLNVGLIMPISPIDGCTAEHWADVKSILVEAIEGITQYDCITKIVSEADDVGVIVKRIVQNIYKADIIICDVSCKNANVMFELGMRLAFDKPTIIIKDEITDYSFDTGIIEHLPYPRDLRFNRMVDFKSKLSKKVLATYEEFLTNPEQSTFLKNFGEFKVATLTETVVTPDNMILDMLTDIQSDVSLLKRDIRRERMYSNSQSVNNIKKAIKDGLNSFLDYHKITFSDFSEQHSAVAINYIEDYLKQTLNTSLARTSLTDTINQLLIENGSRHLASH
jgi:hypothetical protein